MEIREILLKHQKKKTNRKKTHTKKSKQKASPKLLCEGDETLEQVDWEGCGASALEETSKTHRRRP